jgi:hypothetical protein
MEEYEGMVFNIQYYHTFVLLFVLLSITVNGRVHSSWQIRHGHPFNTQRYTLLLFSI